MKHGIKLDITIETGDEEEQFFMVIFPDGSTEFPGRDIEHEVILTELGEEETPAVSLKNHFEEYGILGFLEMGDVCDACNRIEVEGLEDEIGRLSSVGKELWLENICHNLLDFLEYGKHEAAYNLANLIGEFDGTIEIEQEDSYTEDEHGGGGIERYASGLANMALSIRADRGRGEPINCLNFYLYVYGSYGKSSPDNAKWNCWIDENDSFTNSMERLAGSFYIILENEASLPEPYESIDEFEETGPFEKYPGGRWALVVLFDNVEEFTGIYKSQEILEKAKDYIDEWFIFDYDKQMLVFHADKEHDDFVFSSKYDWEEYRLDYDVSEGWTEVK